MLKHWVPSPLLLGSRLYICNWQNDGLTDGWTNSLIEKYGVACTWQKMSILLTWTKCHFSSSVNSNNCSNCNLALLVFYKHSNSRWYFEQACFRGITSNQIWYNLSVACAVWNMHLRDLVNGYLNNVCVKKLWFTYSFIRYDGRPKKELKMMKKP